MQLDCWLNPELDNKTTSIIAYTILINESMPDDKNAPIYVCKPLSSYPSLMPMLKTNEEPANCPLPSRRIAYMREIMDSCEILFFRNKQLITCICSYFVWLNKIKAEDLYLPQY